MLTNMENTYPYQESFEKMEKLAKQHIAAGRFYRFDVQEQQRWFALADFICDTIDLLFEAEDKRCPFEEE